ncbi:hypothetical protein PDJAM_G00096990 [Pangasius djambal]|uniref:Uncharacterized protein n=1 Tax=Pangasius djambal TaxID=1691987 RepID=A0ACC5Z961_9TELE|nr:hypothetical protein [Pangasius djambal]
MAPRTAPEIPVPVCVQLLLSVRTRVLAGERGAHRAWQSLRQARGSRVGRSVTMVFSIPPTHPRPVRFISAISFDRVCEREEPRSWSAECTGEGEDWWRRRTLFWKTSSDAQAVSALLSSARRDLMRHAGLQGSSRGIAHFCPSVSCF